MKKIFLLTYIMIFVITTSEVNAITCYCSDCSECTTQVNNVTCDIVELTANIVDNVGYCINNPINFHDKTFDCKGNFIDGIGAGTIGIYVVSKSYIVIKNCEIKDFSYGIHLKDSSNNNILTDNDVSNNAYGIYLLSSSTNLIKDNIAGYNSGYGIYINFGSNNTIFNNTLDNGVRGISIKDSPDNNILENLGRINTVFGLGIEDSDFNIVLDNVFHTNGYGIALGYSDNNNITRNQIYSNQYGFKIDYDSLNNKFYENNIYENDDYGIYLNSDSNIFFNNNVTENGDVGIIIFSSISDNILENTFICDNLNNDIDNSGIDNIGYNNTCDKSKNWSDSGVGFGCLNICSYSSCFCNDCLGCESRLNYPFCQEVTLLNDISFNGTCIAGTSAPLFKNKIFNCNYHTITGNREELLNIGIFLYSSNYGNVIKNCYIENFTSGIRILYSDDIILQNNVLKNNTDGIYVADVENLKIINTNIISSFDDGLQIRDSKDIDLSILSIYDNNGYGIVFTKNENLNLLSSNILLNKGGLYMLGTYGDIKFNIFCRNMEKDENRYDIYDESKTASGYNNYCDLSYNWNDYSINKGCFFLCSGNYTPPEYNISENETIPLEPQNISEETEEKINRTTTIIPSFVSITGLVEDAGFKTENSKILFVVLFKIIIDIILAMKGLNFRNLIVINFFILLVFAIIGWLPFWIVLLLMTISAIIFAGLFKKLSA